MAPRKNIDKKPTVKRVMKATNSGIKKTKPHSKNTGAVKLKIPVTSSKSKKTVRKKTENTAKVMSPKITRMQLTTKKKVELANEVATVQLNKKPPEAPEPEYVITITRAESVNKRAKKRKEPIAKSEPVENDNTSVTASEDAFDITPKKRKYVKKSALKVEKIAPKPVTVPATKKLKVATKKSPLSTKKSNLKQSEVTDSKTSTISTPKMPEQSPKRSVQKKGNRVTTSRKKKPAIEIGKPENDVSSTNVQASLFPLEQVEYKLPENETLFESPKKKSSNACPVDSRKTSTTGVSDCFSWTKDISSSSTTTCISVCSNDFVRIDNRLPIVKVKNVDYNPTIVQNDTDSSSDSSSSSSECTPRSPEQESYPEIDTRSLCLSTSSVTSKLRTSQPISDENRNLSNETFETNKDLVLEKLAKQLKNIDLEMINWIGYETTQVTNNISKFQESTIKLLQDESDVILYCQCIQQALNPKQNKDVENDNNAIDPVAPVSICQNKNFIEKNNFRGVNDNDKHEKKFEPQPKINSIKDYENKFNFDRVRHTSFDHSCDDDDALSLFAESITGMESSRMNESNISATNSSLKSYEEYIPQPISKDKWKSPNNINYVPSKITNDGMQNCDIKKTVCEKQNADSTSIYKDTERFKDFTPICFDDSQTVPKDNMDNYNRNSKWVPIEKRKTPCLMSSMYKSFHGIKSVVFRGICFYNLISSCKNPVCRFPHVIPDDNYIRLKLFRLSEEYFIQEYMLLRNWPVLRRRYGMVFVEECKRRDLTRFLVEMAIDFHMKAKDNFREDHNMKVNVIEFVLMQLNTMDLNLYEDLLMYNIQQDYLLCDVFMQSIADTQNFSRFKQVFINLTDFMVNHNRKFNLNVATHILERLCILPSEQALSVALLKIVENTDRAIFDNTIMKHFEKQLLGLNNDLYKQFMVLKTECLQKPVQRNNSETYYPNREPEVIIKPLVQDEKVQRYTSPDTTNLDNMNKALDDVVTTRTLDANKAEQFNVQRTISMNSSNSNDSNEDNRAKIVAMPSPQFRAWRGQSVFNKIRELSPMKRPRQFMGPMIKRRIHQNQFGPGLSNFPRRFGPDFS